MGILTNKDKYLGSWILFIVFAMGAVSEMVVDTYVYGEFDLFYTIGLMIWPLLFGVAIWHYKGLIERKKN